MSVFNPGFGAPNASQGGGSTDLTAVSSAGSVLVLSSSGIDAVIPGATATNAGVLSAADKSRLDALSGQLDLPDFATFAEAQASTPTGDFLRTAGYASAGDGGGALYARVASDPGHDGVLQVADGSFFELSVQRVTPHMFGAVGDGATDDFVPLQKFFDYMSTRPEIIGDFMGSWAVSSTINIGGTAPTRFTCGKILGMAPMDDLVVVSGENKNFDGTLQLIGVVIGSRFQFSNRMIKNGLFLNGARVAKFDKIFCEGFQRFGVRLGPTGNNNHVNLGDVNITDCGSVGPTAPGADFEMNFTARSDNGEVGFGQRSTLTVTSIPDFIEVSDLVEIGGRPLLITAINGNQLEVYPRPPIEVNSGPIVCYQGGGVSTLGSDGGLTWMDSITSLRLGTTLRIGALYGLSVGKFHCDFVGVGIQIGHAPLSSGRRSEIGGAYFESTPHHIIHTGSFAANVVIEAPFALDFAKVTRLTPHDTNNLPLQPELPGVTIVSDRIYTPNLQRAFTAAPSSVIVSNRPGENRFMTGQGMSLVLLDYIEDLDRLYGRTDVEVFAFGNGANNQPTGTLTIEPTSSELARGVTINGQNSFVLPSTPNPLYVFLRHYRNENNWRLNYSEIGVPTPGGAISNPSGGGVVDNQARTAINAILTTLRDQRLVSS
ncbi:MAG: hypothetical protein AAGH74_08565 [Pseudomonadota bacterium]